MHHEQLHTKNFKEHTVSTYIGVELANEAGEIGVLEVTRQNVSRKLVRVPHDKAVASHAP